MNFLGWTLGAVLFLGVVYPVWVEQQNTLFTQNRLASERQKVEVALAQACRQYAVQIATRNAVPTFTTAINGVAMVGRTDNADLVGVGSIRIVLVGRGPLVRLGATATYIPATKILSQVRFFRVEG